MCSVSMFFLKTNKLSCSCPCSWLLPHHNRWNIPTASTAAHLDADSFRWWRCSVRYSLPLLSTSRDPGPRQYLFIDNTALNMSNPKQPMRTWDRVSERSFFISSWFLLLFLLLFLLHLIYYLLLARWNCSCVFLFCFSNCMSSSPVSSKSLLMSTQ